MIITRLQQVETRHKSTNPKPSLRSKIKVYLNDELSFFLYQSDILTLGLEEGMDIPPELLHRLMETIVLPRAKQKALDLMVFQDRTTEELREKLRNQLYPESVIDATIEYMKQYRYLDDVRYSSIYIRSRKESKSKKIISLALIRKGVDKEIVESVIAEEYQEGDEDPEFNALRREIKKAAHKNAGPLSELPWEDKQKLMAKLCRKGFDFGKIRSLLEVDMFED